jgi:hypothetical protein
MLEEQPDNLWFPVKLSCSIFLLLLNSPHLLEGAGIRTVLHHLQGCMGEAFQAMHDSLQISILADLVDSLHHNTKAPVV